MKKFPATLLLIFCTLPAFTQIKGVLMDKTTKTPLIYAHISIAKKGFGTITNETGHFEIGSHIYEATDSLEISYLGYLTKKVAIQEIQEKSSATFFLVENSITLKDIEVVAKRFDALALLKKALANNTKKYSQANVLQNAFYRETKQMQSEDFLVEETEKRMGVTVKEAIFETYLPYAAKKIKPQAKYVKGRKLQLADSLTLDTMITALLDQLRIKGGPMENLKHNLHQANQFDFFDKFNKYEYRLDRILMDGKDSIYVIQFDQTDKVKKNLYAGEIFINAKETCITQLNYSSSTKQKDRAFSLKLFGVEMTLADDYGRIAYTNKNGQWELLHSKKGFDILLKVDRRKKKQPIHADIQLKEELDIFINKTLLENANPFSKEEIFRKKDELTIADNYDASFWNNYEVIPLSLLREKTESN